MSLPVPAAGRKGLVSFTLFGFPITIHASFLIVVLLLGYSGRTGVNGALAWLVIVTVSVIVHELGHAFVAAPAGGEPRIDLYMLAGLTTWKPQRASRGRRVAVSVAGPLTGVAFGIVLLFAYTSLDLTADTFAERILGFAVFANLAWGVLNLLPMLPLDGGQVLYALMPGPDERTRLRRAAAASLGVAAVVAFAAIAFDEPFGAVLVIFFAAGNAQTLSALRRQHHTDPTSDRLLAADFALREGDPDRALALVPDPAVVPDDRRPAALLLRSMALLRLGHDREAQDVLFGLPEGLKVDPTYEAAILLANGQDRLARERLAASLPTAPDWAVRELVALLVRRGDDVDGLIDGVAGPGAVGAMTALYSAGRYEEAARWGERALSAGVRDPLIAYNVACAWARAGDAGRALTALDHAVALGLRDGASVDADPDLARLRAEPAYATVRARMDMH